MSELDLQAVAEVLRGVPELNGAPLKALERLPDKGIAHIHLRLTGVRIGGRGVLLRVPRLSQFSLATPDNLAYQAACFARAAPSGHTPNLHAVLSPSPSLPMGALLIDEIDGPPVSLPGDLGAMAACLASVHLLPLPEPAVRSPLADHADPVAGTLSVIEAQSAHIETAVEDPGVRRILGEEIAWARSFAERSAGKPQSVALVLTDTHPGNFLIEPDGRVYFVDLEKALYGSPAIDLAHASLYSSTNWDIDVRADLSSAEVERFHGDYLAQLPRPVADALRPWLEPMRRLTWLRTTTWSCRWYAEGLSGGEDGAGGWSMQGLDPGLIAHVEARIRAFTSPEMVERVRRDWVGPDRLRLE